MANTKRDPGYTVALYDLNGTNYDLTPAILSLSLRETKGQIAQSVTLKVVNRKAEGTLLTSTINVRCRIGIYANDGERYEEVFRGWVWDWSYTSSKEKEITVTCYDDLIYFQKSEENTYFPAGQSTKSICETLCGNWGVKLDYQYESITHGKLPLRGALSDLFLSDILDPVRKQTGKKFVMRMAKDTVQILPVGSNDVVYDLLTAHNVLDTKSNITLDDVVTKVVILGKEDKEGRSKVEATVEGDTKRYGTLQKIETKDEDTTLADAKKEAQETIKEKGRPKSSYEVRAVDIPWIRKGDKVKVQAGNLWTQYIVTSVSRDIGREKIMTLELEDVA